MSDEANQFHDDWNEFLNEEERLEELFGRAKDLASRAGKKWDAAKASDMGKALGKKFTDAGSTIASKVGAGPHGQLSFKDQEAAWKGMSNLPDWTKDPVRVKRQYVIANNKNLAELNDLHDWMVTLTGMAKETGEQSAVQTMGGLAYWWTGRSEVSDTDKQRWASLESKAKTVADAWPEDANEIELGEDGKSAVFSGAPKISSPGAIDVMVLRYLNERYKGKSYAAIENDWRTGKAELNESLEKIYNKEAGLLGGDKPYREPATGLVGAAKDVIRSGIEANRSVEEPAPADTEAPATPPVERSRAAEGVSNSHKSKLNEIGLPKFRRNKKKKCPKIPLRVLKQDFKLINSDPATPTLVIIGSLEEEGFDVIPPLYEGMKEIWQQQDLNTAQRKEANEAYVIFEEKLKKAFRDPFYDYVKFLIKLWKTRLKQTFESYVQLREAANQASCKEAAGGPSAKWAADNAAKALPYLKGTPEEQAKARDWIHDLEDSKKTAIVKALKDLGHDFEASEEQPAGPDLQESIEDRWKRLALL